MQTVTILQAFVRPLGVSRLGRHRRVAIAAAAALATVLGGLILPALAQAPGGADGTPDRGMGAAAWARAWGSAWDTG